MSTTSPTTDATASNITSPAGLPVLNLGNVVATPGALALLAQHGLSARSFLLRHAHADFGVLCADDVQANRDAIVQDLRVLSNYPIGEGNKPDRLWLITDAGHLAPTGSVTTLLLPSEY